MAKKVTDRSRFEGWVVRCRILHRRKEVIFSELSPRPRHGDGDHVPRPFRVRIASPGNPWFAHSSGHRRSSRQVILASKTKTRPPNYRGLDAALQVPETEIRIFGKPTTRKWRRMGVALSQGNSLKQARTRAKKAAGLVRVS